MTHRNRRKGSALIEAAVTLPMFALLLCGAVDISRTLYLNQIAITAARAGAHYALLGDPHALDLSGIERVAAADAGLPGFSAKASRACACSPNAAATSCETTRCSAGRLSYVRVESRIEMKPFIRYPGLPSPFAVRSEALVRVE